MKKIETILLTLLFFISTASASWAHGEITLVNNLKPWDKFDKYLGVIFFYDSTGGTKWPKSVSWQARPYSEKEYDPVSPVGLAASADLSLLIAANIEPCIPVAWTGAVSVDVRHAFMLPAYEKFDNDNIETLLFDCPRQPDDMGSILKDSIDFSRNLLDSDPKLPDDDVTYMDNPDHIVVLDSKGSFVAIADFVTGRAEIEYMPEPWGKTYTYDGHYSFFNGAVTLKKDQFPLSLYFITLSTTQHKISVTVDETMGKITPSDDQLINQGEDAVFAVTANDGYRISSILIDGVPTAIENKYVTEYTFQKVEKTHSIEAIFIEDANAPEIGADKGVSGTVADVIETSDDTEVAAFEKGGFTNDGTVHIVSASGLVTTKTEGTFTADTDGFVQAVKLKVEYEEGAESRGLTLAVKPLDAAKPFSADKKYYALLLNKKTNYYDLFPAALNAAGNLEVAVKPVGDYFSEGTIFVYSGTATDSGTPVTPDTPANPDSGPKSGGGCASGVGALALLAALPLLRRRTGK